MIEALNTRWTPPLQEISNYLSQFSSFLFVISTTPATTAWLPNNIFNLTQSFCVVCQSMRKALRKTFGGVVHITRDSVAKLGEGRRRRRGISLCRLTHNPLVKGIARHPVSMGLKFKRFWKEKSFLRLLLFELKLIQRNNHQQVAKVQNLVYQMLVIPPNLEKGSSQRIPNRPQLHSRNSFARTPPRFRCFEWSESDRLLRIIKRISPSR